MARVETTTHEAVVMETAITLTLSPREAALVYSLLAEVSKEPWVYAASEVLEDALTEAGINASELPTFTDLYRPDDYGLQGPAYYEAAGL
jgi:hypothetical protein